MTKLLDIIDFLEDWAPAELALEWDNPGLQYNGGPARIGAVLVALDLKEAVIAEAKRKKAGLIITHHPLIHKPLKRLDADDREGALLALLVKKRVNFFCMHTNADIAGGGINDELARRFGLKDTAPLRVEYEARLKKVAVFVPPKYADRVADAICRAGAGRLGDYADCTFRTPGTGTFKPLKGANPFIGSKGRLEKVEELRIEAILDARYEPAVQAALVRAHPYEEPAYDFYDLSNTGAPVGIGAVGDLPKPCSYTGLVALVKKTLGLRRMTASGPRKKKYARLAVCGGGGAEFLPQAVRSGADAYLTADVRYHDSVAADYSGITLIDGTHDATERIFVPLVAKKLRAAFTGLRVCQSGIKTEVLRSE